MRINKFVALATGMSRRAADTVIEEGRVTVNNQPVQPGQEIAPYDIVLLDRKQLHAPEQTTTILFHKPVGYVCSRNGQGSQTIYDLLPVDLHALKPIGRLDKDSSGLLLLTNDGQLANQLTHPSYGKQKVYEVQLDKPLEALHHQMIVDRGVKLEDGPSRLQLQRVKENDSHRWFVSMHEGRNRQIRRTFAALGYHVTHLHRSEFGPYRLDNIPPGKYISIS